MERSRTSTYVGRMRYGGLLFVSVFGLCAASLAQSVPTLGSKVPASVPTSSASLQCDTGKGHRDPCTKMLAKGHRLTIAWDKQTKEITYLYTEDRKLVGDSELQVGGFCRIGSDGGRQFLVWILSPDWTEQFIDWSRPRNLVRRAAPGREKARLWRHPGLYSEPIHRSG